MLHFTALERAVLEEICKQADQREVLERQLATARLTRRENTGDGFFTYFTVDRNSPALTSRWRVVGNVAAAIEGFERPLLIALFMNKEGYADMLEGTAAGDSTATIDLSTVPFRINPPDGNFRQRAGLHPSSPRQARSTRRFRPLPKRHNLV